ncbi:MAG: hypothetical protein AAGA92_05560 [Planctomycetota bacterium]
MNQPKHLVLAAWFALLLACSAQAKQKYWALSPYRIELTIAARGEPVQQAGLAAELEEAIRERVQTTLAPRWSLDIKPADAASTHALVAADNAAFALTDEEDPAGYDKRMVLAVDATPRGYLLRCRERDCRVDRWGATQTQLLRQGSMLHDACFALICRTFAPLVEVRSLPDNDDQVEARFKGSELPAQTRVGELYAPGEVFLPMIARTDRSGEIREGSATDMPWTYITLAEETDSGWLCDIRSGLRGPFRQRRRGRVLRLALALRNPPGPATIRFYARHSQELGLTGYEVFRRTPGAETSEPLGLTDNAGRVRVEPLHDHRVVDIFLRSDGQVLAKVPVAAGAKAELEVPIADDTARLRAQAQLTSLRQELMDVVARRNILIARAKRRLEDQDVSGAREFLNQLDDLPSSARFDQRLRSAAESKKNRSEDERVQGRIDKLFDDTRKLLGRFLSPTPISNLRSEVNRAAQGG